jgi:hypothetical protein
MKIQLCTNALWSIEHQYLTYATICNKINHLYQVNDTDSYEPIVSIHMSL